VRKALGGPLSPRKLNLQPVALLLIEAQRRSFRQRSFRALLLKGNHTLAPTERRT
jgi:hypothetical protein